MSIRRNANGDRRATSPYASALSSLLGSTAEVHGLRGPEEQIPTLVNTGWVEEAVQRGEIVGIPVFIEHHAMPLQRRA
jgi:hypothetical protein